MLLLLCDASSSSLAPAGHHLCITEAASAGDNISVLIIENKTVRDTVTLKFDFASPMKYHQIILKLCLLVTLTSGQFSHSEQDKYLDNLNAILEASYSAVNDPTNNNVPTNLLSTCARGNAPTPDSDSEVTVSSSSSTISATEVAAQCSPKDLCIIPSSLTLEMDASLQVAALRILGSVTWTDTTQIDPNVFLCAGYIAIEGSDAHWDMNLQNKLGWIYIMDNSMVHTSLRTRAFGAVSGFIDIQGRKMERTWSLLSSPMMQGASTMELLHDPRLMGWNVGDRIAVAPTEKSSQGWAQDFFIAGIDEDGIVTVDRAADYTFKAEFTSYGNSNGNGNGDGKNVATKSAEVVNLSRNIVITGDDFVNVDAVDELTEANPGEGSSVQGCMKTNIRTKCTYGLHVAHMFEGVSRIQNVRVEKCGQRGVEGKYCFHFHKLNDCKDCLLKNNVIENSHQRGIIVHGTHNSIVENNILFNVRGANVYVEDGNEMHNKIRWNVVICPFPFEHPEFGGCTIPGTSNRISDTSDNQSGFYSRAATNDMVGNRAVNTFNGMFLQALGMGRGTAAGNVCESDARLGRFEGNVFHGHLRFGTYTLGGNFPKVTDQNVADNGYNTNKNLCTGFDNTGITRGFPSVFHHHLDYDSVFVGHYSAGDLQHNGHYSSDNNNLIYWKESKAMEDGCSAHLSGGHYEYGNMALPDQATFIIEDTSFLNAEFEANHHCAVGITGVLCMPQYLMHNVKFKKNGGNWLWFQNWVREDHSYTQVSGGIFSLSPPNAAVVMAQGRLEDSLFPDGYVSVVSSTFLYLLDHPDDACIRASDISDEIGSRYNGSKGGAILCKVPLRSLKIYTRNLLAGNSPSDLKVDAWFNSSTNSNPDATQNIRYHQSGPDNISFKQGYSIPVIPGAENKYRLSLVNDGDILKDWVIEFNDPVIGYRWDEEWITLEVKGRNCAGNGLVSSQHDRRFIWSGDEFLNDSVWDSDGNAIHGACVASGNQPDDMPSKSCTTVQFDGVEPLQCPELCVSKCNDNSFCDCGTAQCFCKPGFGGDDCAVDLCAAARCSSNGTCAAKYLGPGASSLLPVTSQNACVCEDGFSGTLCDRNPCKDVTCDGSGVCFAQGLDTVCRCDDGYSGSNCEISCDGLCTGSYPYNCNPNIPDIVKYGCNSGGGCNYLKDGEEFGNPNDWCVFKQTGNADTCSCSNSNQCQVLGSCNDDGTCPEPTDLEDGYPCNTVPWGICKSGKCVAAPRTCNEDGTASFLKKVKTSSTGDQTAKLKTCTWLSKRKPAARRRFCRSATIFEGHLPAKDICPVSCKACVPCVENGSSRFFLKTKKKNGVQIAVQKSCDWLSTRKESKQDKVCAKTAGGFGFSPAREVCVVQCDSCGWK